MKLKRDYFGQIIEPQYILTKPDGKRIGNISCLKKEMSLSFNAPSEIHFETQLYNEDQKNPYYESIMEGQFVEVIDYGRYVITSCEIESKGIQDETKKCSAISKEVLLGQKYLELFSVNMGTTESIDNVQFYNMHDPEHSLLHLVLDKCPDWEIGHVDTSLMTLQRCFEVTRTDLYSFMTTAMSEAFQCVFLFDSYHNRIHIYSEDTVGTDTDIYVTYQNLLKNTSISSSLDDIKTCLTVTGAGDLNIREVNMGYDRIYMLDYFATTEYMSDDLYSAYLAWRTKWDRHLPTYTALLSQYQGYYENIDYETNGKLPSDPASTTWSEYGLVPLQEKQKIYETKLAVMIKAGQGAPSHRDYESQYLPCYNTIQSIKTQTGIIEAEIKQLKEKQSAVGRQMDAIIADIEMTNNFTANQLKELTLFIREDELSSDNYVVTDAMTDSERMDMLSELLEFGRRELRRRSQPQYQFSASLLNLCAMPEFDKDVELFHVGNYIHIILRDDYIIKAKILQINIDFLNVNDLSVTFGTLSKLNGSNIFSDVTQALNTATSVSSTVSFNASHWNRANKEVNDINRMLSDGLLAAGESLKTSRSDVEIDDRGIIVSNTPESRYQDDKIFIGDGKIMFSDDGLKTIKTAIGHLTYTKKGATYTDFGVLAQFLLAGYIAGSTIEGNEIIGGTITGSHFNNGNGTFSVDENGVLSAAKGRIGCDRDGNGGFVIDSNKLYRDKDSISSGKSGVYLGTDGIALGANNVFKVDDLGNLTATSVTVTGRITANEGYIGGSNGFTIQAQKMYSGKTGIDDGNAGIYLGTDGISLGANSVFKVTNSGILTVTSGQIGGANITNNAICSDNGNWSINSDGTAMFKSVAITGSSTFGSSVNSPFSGTTIPHIESLATNYIKANYLDAMNANIQNLYANEAQLGNLITENAAITNAEIESIKTNYITAAKVKADYMEVSNWTSAGKLRADKIDVNELFENSSTTKITVSSRLFAMQGLDAGDTRVSSLQLGQGGAVTLTRDCRWKTITIDGSTFSVLCQN